MTVRITEAKTLPDMFYTIVNENLIAQNVTQTRNELMICRCKFQKYHVLKKITF